MADPLSKWYSQFAPTSRVRPVAYPGDDPTDTASRNEALGRLLASGEGQQTQDYSRPAIAGVNMRGDQNFLDAYATRDGALEAAGADQLNGVAAAYKAALDQKVAEWNKLHAGSGGGGGGGRGRGGGGGGGGGGSTLGGSGPTAADFGIAALAGAGYGAAGFSGRPAPTYQTPSVYPVEAPPGAERTAAPKGAGMSAAQMGVKTGGDGYGWSYKPVTKRAKVKVGAS